jgi:hypothetical protein
MFLEAKRRSETEGPTDQAAREILSQVQVKAPPAKTAPEMAEIAAKAAAAAAAVTTTATVEK